MTPEERLAAFLADLTALTEKHGLEIGGCGCCGSPFITVSGDGPDWGPNNLKLKDGRYVTDPLK